MSRKFIPLAGIQTAALTTMLTRLTLHNFALINNLTIEFGKGLNVLTGETGAGKSILIDALRLALGERADSSTVGGPDSPAVIEASFEIAKLSHLPAVVTDKFLQPEDEYLILKREINSEGRSRAFINGQFVNLSELKTLGHLLVDIHGQFDHQDILHKDAQRSVVDRLAGLDRRAEDSGEDLTSRYQGLFVQYRKLIESKEEMVRLQAGRERALDLLDYQIREIEAVNPAPGEEERLIEEKIRMGHSEKLHEITAKILERLSDSDESISSELSKVIRWINELSRIDPSQEDLCKSSQGVSLEIEEIIQALHRYRENLTFDPDRFREAESRLDRFDQLKRKYGGSINAVIDFFNQARTEKDRLENSDLIVRELDKELQDVETRMKQAGESLMKIRVKAAKQLSAMVCRELDDLGLRQARFECRIDGAPYHESGMDDLEFMFQANAGFALGPLAEIVSGGEVSRIMLAIKKALAKVDRIPTLIFDEIDANIGGRLGAVMGEKLKSISVERQILLITHLPQIASYADRHYRVKKTVQNGKTRVDYQRLEGDERVRELAQMMSGDRETPISKDHAREMLKTATKK